MNDNMIQVGVVAIRAPDGRVIKDAPLYRPATERDIAESEYTFKEFARVAAKRMHAAARRHNIKF